MSFSAEPSAESSSAGSRAARDGESGGAPVIDPLDAAWWEHFHERPEPTPADLLSPASELAAVLHRYRADVDGERAATREAVARAHAAAAEQAVLVFQLATALDGNEDAFAGAGLDRLHQRLRVLRNQMTRALAGTGVETVDPVGKPFAEVADLVQVVGWRHGPEFGDEVVAETIDPIVMHDEELVRPGRVVMGAPDEETM